MYDTIWMWWYNYRFINHDVFDVSEFYSLLLHHHHHHHLFLKRPSFFAQLGLDVLPEMKPLHISLNTAHSACKPSTLCIFFVYQRGIRHSLSLLCPQTLQINIIINELRSFYLTPWEFRQVSCTVIFPNVNFLTFSLSDALNSSTNCVCCFADGFNEFIWLWRERHRRSVGRNTSPSCSRWRTDCTVYLCFDWMIFHHFWSWMYKHTNISEANEFILI